MTVAEATKKRSSTRSFTTQTVTDNEIQALLNAGLQAPTATNRQEIHFSVLNGDDPLLKEIEDEKNRLRGITEPKQNFYYNAPTVIILSADREFKWSPVDAGIAVQSIALVAEGLGLGSLIIGCIYDALRGEKRTYFEKALSFPDGNEYEIAIAIGHKAAEKEPHTYNAADQVSYL